MKTVLKDVAYILGDYLIALGLILVLGFAHLVLILMNIFMKIRAVLQKWIGVIKTTGLFITYELYSDYLLFSELHLGVI